MEHDLMVEKVSEFLNDVQVWSTATEGTCQPIQLLTNGSCH